MKNSLENLNLRIIQCKRCPRLTSYIRTVARKKVKRFNNQKYWGKPLTGFGDINAELLLIGLAPAAHGGNRTGRMFTGDSSGDWVARILHENGLATAGVSKDINDGFALINTYITASVRCAPPRNKPLKEELDNCSSYLKEEFSILRNVRVIVCFGKIAFDSCCKILQIKGTKFVHGKSFVHGRYVIMPSYHPSKQNTQTGRLTWRQWQEIFSRAKAILNESKPK